MTEAPAKCAHEPCTCGATEGEYCGDHCRENAGKEEARCGCGHAECAGTAEPAVG